MARYQVIFEGEEEGEPYDTYEEAEEAAHKASEAKLAEAEEQAQREADALRQLVEPKREEALEAVITSLV